MRRERSARFVGRIERSQGVETVDQFAWIHHFRHRPVCDGRCQIAVALHDVGQLLDVPDGDDASPLLLGAEVRHLVVVTHLSMIPGPRHRDRGAPLTLEPTHGVAGVGDDDIGGEHPALQLVGRDPCLVLASGTKLRRPRLDEHVVVVTEPVGRGHEPVEGPATHPDGHDHRRHQLSSPTTTER